VTHGVAPRHPTDANRAGVGGASRPSARATSPPRVAQKFRLTLVLRARTYSVLPDGDSLRSWTLKAAAPHPESARASRVVTMDRRSMSRSPFAETRCLYPSPFAGGS